MTAHDELIALCRNMQAAGETPTYASLLARRGGGSRRDLARALRAWRLEQPDGSRTGATPGRPSRVETALRVIIDDQRATIADQADEIRILKEEIASLERMVRKYRAYPEDFEEPS